MIDNPTRKVPPSVVLSDSFDDIDEFSAATRSWDLDFRQIDRGTLDAELATIVLPSTQFLYCRFSRSFYQKGGAADGFRTFGLLDEGITGVNWCGRDIDDSTILNFHPTGEFEAVSSPGFQTFTLSYSERQLHEITEILGIPSINDTQGRTETALVDRKRVAVLRTILQRLFVATSRKPSVLQSSGLHETIEKDLPAQLLLTLTTSGRQRRPPIRRRTLALKRAIAYIEENAHTPTTVLEICKVSGVSWRTLDYAFREHFGITPKQYLTITRLNAVRRELLQVGPEMTVTRVAGRWSFWHMGQFAADYRQHFGELPSKTLAKRRDSSPKIGITGDSDHNSKA